MAINETVRVFNELGTVRKWFHKSKSNPNRPPYTTRLWADGKLSCDCPGWTNFTEDKKQKAAWQGNRAYRSCKHTNMAIAELGRDWEVKNDCQYLKEKK